MAGPLLYDELTPWVEVLSGAGYVIETLRRPIDVERWDEVILCRSPA